MKRYFYRFASMVLVVALLFGVVGCESKEKNVVAETTEETPWHEELFPEYDADLTTEDMKYDMANLLDTYFHMSGYAKLSTYYNYGFGSDLEKDYFALEITPAGSNDTWYVYCHRKSFNDIFQDLKDKGKVYIFAICEVPKEKYKTGQKSMAELIIVTWN